MAGSANVNNGKYRLIAEIGRGGMAEVFLAVTSAGPFSKLVVIKKLPEHLAGDADFASMLMDEARIAGMLNHPNLVQTIEVGEWNGELYIAMEYLDGQPLHRIVQTAKKGLPLAMHLTVMHDVLVGMEYAHDLKDFQGEPLHIVHRDVTPHNVFVTYQGVTKVVDFGIAKAVGRSSETRHGVVKGKARYMAPEQARGETLDRRVDIFAIGVMFYEGVAGKRLWAGSTNEDIIRALVSGRVPSSPKEVNPSVDDELDAICRRALAVRREDRYQTAHEMLVDVEKYIASHGASPSPQEIGAYVAGLFAKKREEIGRIIREQLADMKSISSSTSIPIPKSTSSSRAVSAQTPAGMVSSKRVAAAPASEDSSSLPPSQAEHTMPLETLVNGRPPPAATAGAKAQPPPEEPKSEPVAAEAKAAGAMEPIVAEDAPPRHDRMRIVAGVLAIVLAIGATIALLVGRRPSDKDAGGGTSSVEAPISVTLRATPAEAKFSIDDGPPLDNPYIGTFPRDRKEHRVRAMAPGIAPKEQLVVFEDDVSIRFALSSAAASSASASASAHPHASASATTAAPSASASSKPPVKPPTGPGRPPHGGGTRKK